MPALLRWLPATLAEVHVSVGSGGQQHADDIVDGNARGGGGGYASRSAVRYLVEAVAERLPRLHQLSVDVDVASIQVATWHAFERLPLER